MKQKILLSLIIILINLEYTPAQWQPAVRLTNNTAFSGLSNNNASSFATVGNVVHTVWYDDRDGNNEIYYKRSTDGGISWGTDKRLTNNSFVSEWPSISASDLNVHVIWYDNRDGNPELYFKHSSDGGESWGTDTRLTNAVGNSYNPSMSVSGQTLHIVWYDNRDGNNEIYYKRSIDNGTNWGADTRLSNNSALSWDPAVAVSGNFVHIVWWDERDGNYEIYYIRSTDGGINWGTEIRLTNDGAQSGFVNISALDSLVFLIWDDNRDGNHEIYYKLSTNNGVSWGIDTRLTNDSGHSERPTSFISSQFLHVTWEDDRDGNNEIYYNRSTDLGITWESDTRVTNNSNDSDRPFVSVTDSVVGIIWMDNRDGNYEIYYKRNPIGNPLDIKNLTPEGPYLFSLKQNYPNPFNPITAIEFDLSKTSEVSLKVFNLLGEEVATLVSNRLSAGSYSYEWDASNLASGVYLYKLEARDYVETRKMVLMR